MTKILLYASNEKFWRTPSIFFLFYLELDFLILSRWRGGGWVGGGEGMEAVKGGGGSPRYSWGVEKGGFVEESQFQNIDTNYF